MEQQTSQKPAHSPKRIILISVLAVWAVVLVLLAGSLHYYRAIGAAMLPTIAEGDMMICHRSRIPQPGDIIIFQVPSYMTETMVKRVVATEGQHVVIDYKSNCVLVDGVPLDEPYVSEPMEHPQNSRLTITDITVPPNCVFVLGDNRNHSVDSRDEQLGCISISDIKGKVLWVLHQTQKK